MSSSPSTFRSFGIPSGLLLLASVLPLTPACSSPADPPASTGGSSAAGTSTGGASSPTGGSATGGTAQGGTATGGAATGGTTTGGTATGGMATGGTATGGQLGGGAGGASSGGSGGGAAGAGGASNAGSGGNAGGNAGAGGAANGGAAGAGKGGAGGASNAGSGGAAGGAGSGKSAVAMLAPTTGNQVTGTGTFTQTGQSVTLVIQVSNCPMGSHASHIHVTKSCGNNGEDAGLHWVPQGEVIPDIVCAANGMGTATVTPPAGTWTIGAGAADVTTHALMVHTGSNSNPGGRIACGVINAQ